MAAVAIFNFDFHFRFCVGSLWSYILNLPIKFHQNPSIFVRDTVIFRKSNMAAAAILNFYIHFRFLKFSFSIMWRMYVQNVAKIERLTTKWQHVIEIQNGDRRHLGYSFPLPVLR